MWQFQLKLLAVCEHHNFIYSPKPLSECFLDPVYRHPALIQCEWSIWLHCCFLAISDNVSHQKEFCSQCMCLLCVRAMLKGGARWEQPHPSLWGATPLCGIYCSWVTWPSLPPPCLSITTFLPLSPLILLLYSVRQASFSCYSVLKIWVWLCSAQRGRRHWIADYSSQLVQLFFLSSCISPAGQSLEPSSPASNFLFSTPLSFTF